MIQPNEISYRDRGARVVKKETGYYRYIFTQYKAEYNHLMHSGLYQELVEKQFLIPHQEVAINSPDSSVYKLLYPTQIHTQSYPFEWSYAQWKKALLCCLKINQIALQYGMILKDASPYNFYQTAGKAILFDTSSFSFFQENDPWIGYKQFCESFFAPLALMHYQDSRWSTFTMAHFRGMPLNMVSKQLPLKSWFNISSLLHIHLHALFSEKRADARKAIKTQKGFTTEKLQLLMQTLFNTIASWKKSGSQTPAWANYYNNDIASEAYLADKEATVGEWLCKLKPASVIDLGANTGKFSLIAAGHAQEVIALEADEACVDVLDQLITEKQISNITTLVGDITTPSPGLGLFNKEIKSLFERVNSQLVLALALTHHLAITHYMSFPQIAELMNQLSSQYLIIEFIPIEDPKVIMLMEHWTGNKNDYQAAPFIESLASFFTIIAEKKLAGSSRSLYLMQKKKDEAHA